MASNFTQQGNRLTFAATGATASGALVALGAVFGVALHAAKTGDDLTIQCGGCWTLPKTSADKPAQFDAAYWTGSKLTTAADDGASNSYTKVGIFMSALTASSTTAEVRLNSSF